MCTPFRGFSSALVLAALAQTVSGEATAQINESPRTIFLPVQACLVEPAPDAAGQLLADLDRTSLSERFLGEGIVLRSGISNALGMLRFPLLGRRTVSEVSTLEMAGYATVPGANTGSAYQDCLREWSLKSGAGSGVTLLVTDETPVGVQTDNFAAPLAGCFRDAGGNDCSWPLSAVATVNMAANSPITDQLADGLSNALSGSDGPVRAGATSGIDVEFYDRTKSYQTGGMGLVVPRPQFGEPMSGLEGNGSITGLSAALDQPAGRLHFGLRLKKHYSDPESVWAFLLQIENAKKLDLTQQIAAGIPPALVRSELSAVVIVRQTGGVLTAYLISGDMDTTENTGAVTAKLRSLFLHPVFDGAADARDMAQQHLEDEIAVQMPASTLNISEGMRVQIEVASIKDGAIQDRMGRSVAEITPEFRFRPASFAHCDGLQPGIAGLGQELHADGLVPSRPVYALFDGERIWSGRTGRTGEIDTVLPVPDTVLPGRHIVTIVVDGTDLSATCTVETRAAQQNSTADLPPEALRSLIAGQQSMIDRFGAIVEILVGRGGEAKAEVAQLQDMILRNMLLLERVTAPERNSR